MPPTFSSTFSLLFSLLPHSSSLHSHSLPPTLLTFWVIAQLHRYSSIFVLLLSTSSDSDSGQVATVPPRQQPNMHSKALTAALLLSSASLSVALPAVTDTVSINPIHAVLAGSPQDPADPKNFNKCGPKHNRLTCSKDSSKGGRCCSDFVSCCSRWFTCLLTCLGLVWEHRFTLRRWLPKEIWVSKPTPLRCLPNVTDTATERKIRPARHRLPTPINTAVDQILENQNAPMISAARHKVTV